MLTIEDDKVFNLKFVKYNRPQGTVPKVPTVDSSCRVRIGRIQSVILYKFLSDFKCFIDPFFNMDSYESYKVQAQTVVHDAVSQCCNQLL